jgi:hypothetical protein
LSGRGVGGCLVGDHGSAVPDREAIRTPPPTRAIHPMLLSLRPPPNPIPPLPLTCGEN